MGLTMASDEMILLRPEGHAVLGPAEFHQEGLITLESIGAFTRIRRCEPLTTIHDSVVEAGKGIGHHPHRHVAVDRRELVRKWTVLVPPAAEERLVGIRAGGDGWVIRATFGPRLGLVVED